jgi:hypothetical protein
MPMMARWRVKELPRIVVSVGNKLWGRVILRLIHFFLPLPVWMVCRVGWENCLDVVVRCN